MRIKPFAAPIDKINEEMIPITVLLARVGDVLGRINGVINDTEGKNPTTYRTMAWLFTFDRNDQFGYSQSEYKEDTASRLIAEIAKDLPTQSAAYAKLAVAYLEAYVEYRNKKVDYSAVSKVRLRMNQMAKEIRAGADAKKDELLAKKSGLEYKLRIESRKLKNLRACLDALNGYEVVTIQ